MSLISVVVSAVVFCWSPATAVPAAAAAVCAVASVALAAVSVAWSVCCWPRSALSVFEIGRHVLRNGRGAAGHPGVFVVDQRARIAAHFRLIGGYRGAGRGRGGLRGGERGIGRRECGLVGLLLAQVRVDGVQVGRDVGGDRRRRALAVGDRGDERQDAQDENRDSHRKRLLEGKKNGRVIG